jgi:hypothetical protein
MYRMHYRVKRRINKEVSGDDVIITVYVIQVWPECHYDCLSRHSIKVSVSNEVNTVCTMQGYKTMVSIRVSVGVCILSQCILTRTIRMFSNEVTEDSKAVLGYDEQLRCVYITMEYIVEKWEKE